MHLELTELYLLFTIPIWKYEDCDTSIQNVFQSCVRDVSTAGTKHKLLWS